MPYVRSSEILVPFGGEGGGATVWQTSLSVELRPLARPMKQLRPRRQHDAEKLLDPGSPRTGMHGRPEPGWSVPQGHATAWSRHE
jgi:hypothetical protein